MPQATNITIAPLPPSSTDKDVHRNHLHLYNNPYYVALLNKLCIGKSAFADKNGFEIVRKRKAQLVKFGAIRFPSLLQVLLLGNECPI